MQTVRPRQRSPCLPKLAPEPSPESQDANHPVTRETPRHQISQSITIGAVTSMRSTPRNLSSTNTISECHGSLFWRSDGAEHVKLHLTMREGDPSRQENAPDTSEALASPSLQAIRKGLSLSKFPSRLEPSTASTRSILFRPCAFHSGQPGLTIVTPYNNQLTTVIHSPQTKS